MGSIMDFLIALEAEDITKDVDKEMKKAIGSKSIKSTMNKDDRDTMGETDDLLGTKGNKKEDNKTPDKKVPKEEDAEEAPKDTTDNNEDNIDDTDTTDTNEDDMNLDDSDSMGDEDGEDTDNLDSDPDKTPEEDKEPDEELSNKISLRENMILFYNILSSNIKLLSEYTPDKDIEKNKDVISTVSKNFVECKSILFNIMTEELESKSYVELLRKYIALNRVYDLNIRMLDTYFSDLKLISTKIKK